MIRPELLGAWRSLFAATLLSAATAEAQTDVTATQLDQNIQKLKSQALDIGQQAQTLQDDYLYPKHSRVSVYVGVLVPGMLLTDVTVAIDDEPAVNHHYDELESVVLQNRGLQRLLLMKAEPGSHRIHATYVAHYSDAKPTDPPFTGGYDGTFDKDEQPADLELDLDRKGYLGDLQLRFRSWKAVQ
jgi:hypothetical protein